MKNFIQALKELKEEKPGLWANIRAKRARGEKPAHKNSNAHKDAVKAGKKINKMSEGQEWPKTISSRYGDEYEFRLVKVEPTYKGKPGRAKYEVVDLESGEVKGIQVYTSPDILKAAAADLIKPQGGRQSSQF